MKHLAKTYRNISGKQYENYCDLIYSDKENLEAINEAKKLYKSVRVIKHYSGEYSQVFGSND